MSDTCAHRSFASNVHCSGCGRYAPKIIAELEAENAKLKSAMAEKDRVIKAKHRCIDALTALIKEEK